MSKVCHYNTNNFCELFNCSTVPELCQFCKGVDGVNTGFAKMQQAVKPFQGMCAEKNEPVKTEEEIKICLDVCKACPHSTVTSIKASEITEWPIGIKHLIALVGNFLRKINKMGLSCKLCGCSCRKKAEFVSKRLISGGCPDIDKETKLSRWEAALKKAGR